MKNKYLSINLAANLVAFVINSGMAFFLTPYIVTRIGVEAFGIAQLALQMTNYAAIFTVALNSMSARFISIEINKNNNEQANLYFNSVLRANAVIALLLAVPSLLIVLFVEYIYNIPQDILTDARWTFAFVFINTLIALAGNVFSVAAFVKDKLYLQAARSIEGNIIRIFLLVALFLIFAPHIAFVTLTSIAMTVYLVATNVYYTKRLMPEIRISMKTYSATHIKTLVASGIWNSIEQLSSVILSGLDLWIVNVLLGATLMGQYSLSKTIALLIMMMSASVAMVFTPRFTILYAQQKSSELVDSIKLSMKIMGILIALPTAFMFVFGEVFFALWTPGEDARTLYLLSGIVLIPMMISAGTQTFSGVYKVANKLKIPASFLLLSGIVSISLAFALFYLTPLGLFAFPVATLVVRGIRAFTFGPLYAARCLGLKWHTFYPLLFKGILCSVIMIGIGSAWRFTVGADSWLMLIVAVMVCGLAALAACVFLMFSAKEIKRGISMLRKGKRRSDGD